MLAEIYETAYGIYDHIGNAKLPRQRKRPLASIAFHQGEDFVNTSTVADTMRIFAEYPINEMWGINFLEFISLPAYICEDMIKMAKDKRVKDEKSSVDAARALSSQGQPDKGGPLAGLKGLKLGKGQK